MAAPESPASGASPGLFVSLRSFWSVLVAILYTRLDLATAELEEEATRAVQLVMICIAALLSTGMAVFFVMFFLLVTFWDEKVLVLGIISGVCIVGSLAFVLIARQMVVSRPKFLSQTLAELRRDLEGLHTAAVVKKEEPKP